MRPFIAVGTAVIATVASAADVPPRGDGFELQTLAYVITELESCATLDADLRRRYDAMLLKAPGMKRALDEFRLDPHYAAFQSDIARRRASAPPDVVESECSLMLQGFDSASR